jgi:CBS domain-containing protein
MSARLIMNNRPVSVGGNARLRDAAALIMKHKFRNLPVIDEHGRYLGVISSNRLLRIILPKAATMDPPLERLEFVHDTIDDLRERWKEAEDRPVSEFLDSDVKTVAPETSLDETLLSLYHNRTSLPVVDKQTGRLVGIVSHWSVGNAVVGPLEEQP